MSVMGTRLGDHGRPPTVGGARHRATNSCALCGKVPGGRGATPPTLRPVAGKHKHRQRPDPYEAGATPDANPG